MRSRIIRMMLAILAIILILMALISWYTNQYSMNIASSYEVNSPKLETHILIATQGSEFKEELTQNIVNQFKSRPIHIKIIDVTRLHKIQEKNWDVIVVIQAWQYLEPQENVVQFVKNISSIDKIIMVTTSWEGDEVFDGIDGITSASVSTEVDIATSQVIVKIEDLLKSPPSSLY